MNRPLPLARRAVPGLQQQDGWGVNPPLKG